MARTILAIDDLVGPYPVLPVVALSLDTTWTAGDVANGNRFISTGREILQAHNTHAVNGHTVTVHSVVNDMQRDGDITTYALAAGERMAFNASETAGWRQADGYIYVNTDDAIVFFNILRLP